MEHHLFEEFRVELIKGISKKGHPFRYFTLATLGLQNDIGLRTVVLRKVYEDLTLSFYTDKRSKKIEELKSDQTVSALFYHPQKMLQIKVTGIAQFEDNDEVLNTFWNGIPQYARKDYTTQKAPGTPLDENRSISYLSEENHFTIVHIIPQQIEVLQLGKPNHTRVLFSKAKNGWHYQDLVP